VLGLHVLDGELAGPLTLDQIQRVLFAALREECRSEAVLLAGQPAASAVVNLRRVAGRGLDCCALVELDKRRAGNEPFDVEGWKRDVVVFVELVEVEQRVPNLLDIDSP